MLVSLDGTVLAEARSTLVVGSVAQMIVPAESPTLKQKSPLTPPMPVPADRSDNNTQVAPRPPVLSSEERERALSYLKKGDEQVAEGNIAAARLFYIRAANSSLAQGAMALASTYDATELARLNVRGVEPDAKEATRWYERARELGATDAEQRLKRLSAH
jgi:TPR repeat protein